MPANWLPHFKPSPRRCILARNAATSQMVHCARSAATRAAIPPCSASSRRRAIWLSLSDAGFFRGRYHVLGGRLAPLDNMGPERLATESLLRRVQQGGVQEVILATSPTLEGDGTALYVSNLLAPTGVKITRLARGLPSGTSLDLVNAQMLSDAVEGRRAF